MKRLLAAMEASFTVSFLVLPGNGKQVRWPRKQFFSGDPDPPLHVSCRYPAVTPLHPVLEVMCLLFLD